MAEFSATDAAFTGFRVVWQRPVALIVWIALWFVASVAYTLFITVSAGPAIMQARDAPLPLNGDPTPLLTQLAALAPTYAALLVALLVFYAVFYAAMNRAVLRPQQSRFGYLRLAGDELRQLGLFALMAALALGVYLIILAAGGVVAALLSMLLGEGSVLMSLAIVLPAMLVAFVYLGVRFSLASPLTFERGRIDLFGSWRLTHGRFWRLFGAYALALGLNLIVAALTLAIAVFALAIIGGGFSALGQGVEPNLTSIGSALAPQYVVYLAITAIGQALGLPIAATPPAAIYRALTGGSAGALSKVFD